MTISQIIGKNIGDLMERENISLRKLSDSIGISHPTLKRYVDGDQPIDSEKLMLISKYFGKSFDYFFRDSKLEFNFMFRADNPDMKLNNLDLEEYKLSLMNYIDVVNGSKVNFIPQSYSLKIDGKTLSKTDEDIIEKISLENRRIFSIDGVIPENYYEVVERAGINLIVKGFKNLSFFGASSYSAEYGSFILINNSEQISEERKIFSLIHEYAHLIFDREQYINYSQESFYSNSSKSINEKIANKFAAYFLVPRNMVETYILERNKEVNLLEMKRYFKVSLQTLYTILYEYNYVSRDSYNRFWKEIAANDMKKTEPSPLAKIKFEDKNLKLISTVKELFIKDEISINKISDTLGLNTIESRELVKKWRDADERYLLVS